MGASHPNRFLASLDTKDFDLLLPQLKPFELVHETGCSTPVSALIGSTCRTAAPSRWSSVWRTDN